MIILIIWWYYVDNYSISFIPIIVTINARWMHEFQVFWFVIQERDIAEDMNALNTYTKILEEAINIYIIWLVLIGLLLIGLVLIGLFGL